MAGFGRGTATLVRATNGQRDASPLRLALGLVEGRRRVATIGSDLQVAVRGEASWAQLATGAGDTTVDALQAGVRRTRGGVEVTRALSGPGGATWTPFGAVSTRHDGGAGQTGVGLEVAGGLRVRGGRMQFEAQGRKLVLHSATAYEEQGVAVAASFGSSPYEPGLTLSLRPTWGAAGMGAESLWQDEIQHYLQGAARDAAGIDAQVGYGLRLPGGGLLTPFGAYGQRQANGRRLQVGALVGTLGHPGSFDRPIQLEISGERYERPGNSPDHRFSMVGVVNLGRSESIPGPATSQELTTAVAAPDAGGDPRLAETVAAGVMASEAGPAVPRASEPGAPVRPVVGPTRGTDGAAPSALPVTRRARIAPDRPARSAATAVSAARVPRPRPGSVSEDSAPLTRRAGASSRRMRPAAPATRRAGVATEGSARAVAPQATPAQVAPGETTPPATPVTRRARLVPKRSGRSAVGAVSGARSWRARGRTRADDTTPEAPRARIAPAPTERSADRPARPVVARAGAEARSAAPEEGAEVQQPAQPAPVRPARRVAPPSRPATVARVESGANRPPAFTASVYELVMPVGRDGRPAAARLGAVLAQDPDRDPVIYTLSGGEWTRFAVDPSSGSVTYTGSGEDHAAAGRQYELTVTARDMGRLTGTVRVVVTLASAG